MAYRFVCNRCNTAGVRRTRIRDALRDKINHNDLSHMGMAAAGIEKLATQVVVELFNDVSESQAKALANHIQNHTVRPLDRLLRGVRVVT